MVCGIFEKSPRISTKSAIFLNHKQKFSSPPISNGELTQPSQKDQIPRLFERKKGKHFSSPLKFLSVMFKKIIWKKKETKPIYDQKKINNNNYTMRAQTFPKFQEMEQKYEQRTK